MALKREIKDAYIEKGASIYVKTHSNAVYVDDNETETLTQRLDNVKSSIAKHTTQLDNIENKQEVFVTDFGADITGLNDSYMQIQNAIDYAYSNNRKVVVFPEGRYKITNGFKFRNGIKYLSPNNGATIFIDDSYVGTSEGVLGNYNASNTYNGITADSFELENLTFLYDSNLKFNSKTFLLMKNVNGVNINKCKFIQNKKLATFEAEITNLDLYACCKNVNITNCEFTILSDTSAGGNIWIRNFAIDNEDLSNLTENIIIDNCKFLKQAHDEMIAVFNTRGGSIRNVTIKNSSFKMLESTSISPICLAFRATAGTFTENVLFENNIVDIDNFSFHVLEINRGEGLLKNCNIINNTFYVRTKTSSNTYLTYGTGPIENVNMNFNNIFINKDEGEYPMQYGINKISNTIGNYIKGHVLLAFHNCDHVFNNKVELSSDFKGVGTQNCRNVCNNTFLNVETGVKVSINGSYLLTGNRITLQDRELSVPFMFQGTILNCKAIVRDNFVEGINSNLRYIWLDSSPDIQVSFENNRTSGNFNFYSAGAKLYYAKNNIIGQFSDTYVGIPNYRLRDVLPIGHQTFDPTTLKKYIKVSTVNNNNTDWKEISMTLV